MKFTQYFLCSWNSVVSSKQNHVYYVETVTMAHRFHSFYVNLNSSSVHDSHNFHRKIVLTIRPTEWMTHFMLFSTSFVNVSWNWKTNISLLKMHDQTGQKSQLTYRKRALIGESTGFIVVNCLFSYNAQLLPPARNGLNLMSRFNIVIIHLWLAVLSLGKLCIFKCHRGNKW